MKSTNYIKIHQGHIEAQLDVIFYVEDGVAYAYAPALELLGYGDSQEEAKASFEIVLEDFFEFGLKRGTLQEDLLQHHWVLKTDEYSLPKAWTLFDKDKQLQEIYAGSFSKVTYPVSYATA